MRLTWRIVLDLFLFYVFFSLIDILFTYFLLPFGDELNPFVREYYYRGDLLTIFLLNVVGFFIVLLTIWLFSLVNARMIVGLFVFVLSRSFGFIFSVFSLVLNLSITYESAMMIFSVFFIFLFLYFYRTW